MKKWFAILIGIKLLLSIVFIFVFAFLLYEDTQVQKKKRNKPVIQLTDEEIQSNLAELRNEVSGQVSDDQLKEYKKQGLNPFGEKTKHKGLTTVHYNEYIHGMTHQKVHASKKWGYYEIHPERVVWLLDGLNEVNIENEELYREILMRWKNNDFSQIDEEHNTIWNMQGGVVGIATGIMTEDEERKYMESKK